MSSGDELSVASLLDATIATDGDVNEVESIDDESDYSTSTFTSDAEREWEESLKQLELLLGMVVVPFVGKYFGRKCAYWGWARFMEWQFPVTVTVTSKKSFRAAGALEAAIAL